MAATIQTGIQSARPRHAVWWRWAVVCIPGALLFFLPLPGLNQQQSRLLAVFLATIVALVAQPVRMGVSVIVAMTLLALTNTLPPAKVLSGFANVTVWLIFTAFLFARAVIATGFGIRVGAVAPGMITTAHRHHVVRPAVADGISVRIVVAMVP